MPTNMVNCHPIRVIHSSLPVRAMGYIEEFIPLWEFYLCFCEGGFTERYLGDVQLLYAKPRCRQPAWPSLQS